MIKKLMMWYKHIKGTNEGKIIFWIDEDGNNCVGFKCECGEIHGEAIISDNCIDGMMRDIKLEKNEIS